MMPDSKNQKAVLSDLVNYAERKSAGQAAACLSGGRNRCPGFGILLDSFDGVLNFFGKLLAQPLSLEVVIGNGLVKLLNGRLKKLGVHRSSFL